VRLNGTLISPQTDTYHYKAYIETLLNFDRDDGDTILKPQGWFNFVDVPNALTANQLTLGHDDFKAMTPERQDLVRELRSQATDFAGGVTRTYSFIPHIAVFHLSKLLIPNVQIGIQMYLNSPDVWMLQMQGVNAFRLNAADNKVKLYLCQVRLNPSVYRELMNDMGSGRNMVSYPTVRSEIRTYNITRNELHYEITNPFQNRLPNMLVVGLVASTAFNGAGTEYPFTFQ